MGEPLAPAQVKDLLEDLLAIPDHQGHEDYKGERGDQELERELGIAIVEGQEQADLVADEPGPDAEDDRIDTNELLVLVHDATPTPIIAAPETSGACIVGNNRPIMVAPATSMRTPYTNIRNPSLRRLGVLRDPIMWTVLPRMKPPSRSRRVAPR